MDSKSGENIGKLRGVASRLLVFAAVVAIIVYFLPKGDNFHYHFEKGKPWKYGLLQASFDFPIYKNSYQVQKEKDSLLSTYKPYYHIDNTVESEMIIKLRANLRGGDKKLLRGREYRNHLETLLRMVYRNGVISSADYDNLLSDSITELMLVSHNRASSYSLSQFMSSKQAYTMMIEADTVHFPRFVMQQFDLNQYIKPNLIFEKERSEESRRQLLAGVTWASGYVVSGQRIIDRGEIVTQDTYNILESMRRAWNSRGETARETAMTVAGQILYAVIILGFFMVYLISYRRGYFNDWNKYLLLMTTLGIFPIITSVMVENAFLSVYIVPYAMGAIFVRVFLDSRTALNAHITMVLLCSIPLHYPFEFIFLQVSAGMAAIYSLRELSQRSQIFRTAAAATVCYILLFISYEMIQYSDLGTHNLYMYVYFVVNGLFLLFTYPILFVIEKLFGFTSNVTLIELSNINNPLLRELSEVAPGTFQHSMQMSNLAAAAANAIGANSQLVRTGALYHDIGKMLNPAFFTENQSGYNPHVKLTWEQSAQVIIAHVSDGLRLAEKHHLPRAVRDFIITHHGRGVTKYFFFMAKNENPDKEVDPDKFRYPGPNPFTKEQGILLMADSVEAASRSLKEYTEESISNIVDKIVDSQVADGYFKECPINFREILMVKELFKEKLRTMYHTRIKYPELSKKVKDQSGTKVAD